MRETLQTPKAVIDALGGTRATAALTGSKYSAVWQWCAHQRIPPKFYLLMIAELEKVGEAADPCVWGMANPQGKAQRVAERLRAAGDSEAADLIETQESRIRYLGRTKDMPEYEDASG